jgi:hypothetical protein
MCACVEARTDYCRGIFNEEQSNGACPTGTAAFFDGKSPHGILAENYVRQLLCARVKSCIGENFLIYCLYYCNGRPFARQLATKNPIFGNPRQK